MAELSIVIPAYNEERRLGKTLDALSVWIRNQNFSVETLVVDDGSKDGTVRLVENFIAAHPDSGFALLRNPHNMGKGAAVRNGVLHSTGNWVLFSDADLSTPIEEYAKLRAAANERNPRVAIGSRAKDRSLVGRHQSAAREASGRFFNFVMRSITGLHVQDTQCGFKLMHGPSGRRIYSVQKLDGFSFDVEMLVIAQENGLGIAEVPVRWFNADDSKVTLMSGLRSFADLLTIASERRSGAYRFTS
ncbi:dolichyl-phosphate beta-glucosyltransferase [Bryobacter aggregatus]|uniref:dolichyl-phosphate beta-glucosyltransferase n=1 Tax=Bryobacter aggregatus TaxID=360054 RepID=UPI0006893322|nr:dolichyl-phosphate beta-glucosyltransferase [Bryobacter aggregatus]